MTDAPGTATESDPGSDEEPRTPFREWPAAGRWAVYVVIALVLLLVLLAFAGATTVRRSWPETEGTVRIEGLDGPVDILRDAHGIPQIYADTARDLFRAQGYVQAQDRFWQMDYRRHLTAGRLSELLGEEALEADMMVRSMGWRRIAERELDLLAPESRAHLEAFSAGVNDYLASRGPVRLSLEYAVLGLGGVDYQPEPWNPVDSLAWLKAMAWDLRGNMQDEMDRARLAVDRSPEQIAELYPPYPYGENDPITRFIRASSPTGTSARVGSGADLGSNSWVVSGRHTESGRPLLANDPHLAPSLPGVWYQSGLHCREFGSGCPFDVTGFTFAGMPGVVIGHNRRIAWGFTNLAPDVTDLYLEKIEGNRYLYGGAWVPLTTRDEIIRIQGQAPRTITVRSTRHGPVLSDVSRELSSVGANARVPEGSPARGNGYGVALSWTALEPSATADAIFALDTAGDWEAFREAARMFSVPAQNIVYADVDGDIGYQAPGAIPVRRPGHTGDDPVPGWLPRYDWTGRTIPFEELPTALNPDEGFIVTANQAVADPSYPHRISGAFDAGFRSQRIRRLLADLVQRRTVDVDDMARVQLDARSPMASVLVPHLLQVLLPSQYYADGQRLLAQWNLRQDADSPGAAYFNAVWRNLLRLTFHDQLRPSLWPEGDDRWFLIVRRLLEQPTNAWWDDAHTPEVVENRDSILAAAMRDARDELTRRVALDPDEWEWGDLHQLELQNETLGRSKLALVRALFNRGPYPLDGGGALVNASSWDARVGYVASFVPSMRMIVDLADFDRSRWVNLTGASGHAFHAHYTDQTQLWLEGKYLPWVFSEEAVGARAEQRLELRPRD